MRIETGINVATEDGSVVIKEKKVVCVGKVAGEISEIAMEVYLDLELHESILMTLLDLGYLKQCEKCKEIIQVNDKENVECICGNII